MDSRERRRDDEERGKGWVDGTLDADFASEEGKGGVAVCEELAEGLDGDGRELGD